MLASRPHTQKPDTFRTETAVYKVIDRGEYKTIHPHFPGEFGTTGEAIAYYFPERDKIEWRGIAEPYKTPIVKAFHAWIAATA